VNTTSSAYSKGQRREVLKSAIRVTGVAICGAESICSRISKPLKRLKLFTPDCSSCHEFEVLRYFLTDALAGRGAACAENVHAGLVSADGET